MRFGNGSNSSDLHALLVAKARQSGRPQHVVLPHGLHLNDTIRASISPRWLMRDKTARVRAEYESRRLQNV